MRRHSFIKYIAVLAAFLIGILANVAARTFLLSRILPATLQPMTGLLALLIQIIVSVVVVLAIGWISGRRNR